MYDEVKGKILSARSKQRTPSVRLITAQTLGVTSSTCIRPKRGGEPGEEDSIYGPHKFNPSFRSLPRSLSGYYSSTLQLIREGFVPYYGFFDTLNIEYFDRFTGKWCLASFIVGKELKTNRKFIQIRIKGSYSFYIGCETHLHIEHSDPFMKDFRIEIKSRGKGRHTIAVFSEEDGKKCLEILSKLGATLSPKSYSDDEKMGTHQEGTPSSKQLVRRKSTGSSERKIWSSPSPSRSKINRTNSMNNAKTSSAVWYSNDDNGSRGHGGDIKPCQSSGSLAMTSGSLERMDGLLSKFRSSRQRQLKKDEEEDDKSTQLLEPGKFGLIESQSTYVRIDRFDDYPPSIYEMNEEENEEDYSLRVSKSEWIRRSFEELNCNVINTKRDSLTLTKRHSSVGNLTDNAKENIVDDGSLNEDGDVVNSTYL